MSEAAERDLVEEGNDSSKRVVGITSGGNKIRIVMKTNSKYVIKFFEGGVLPDMLKGEFTSYKVAEDKVKLYLALAELKQVTKKTKVPSTHK